MKRTALALFGLLVSAPAPAATLQIAMPDWSTVPIVDHDLGHGVHAIESFGGNIGVVSGDQGLLLIDAGYPQLATRLRAAFERVSSQPVRLVVDTHYHWDHTGGNAGWAKSGALVVATERTRANLIEKQKSDQNRPGEFLPDGDALPSFTVTGEAVIRWGGQTLQLIALPGAHTDGDLIVRFVDADVIQAGDTFTNGFYPYIDVAHGGSIDGMIAAADRMLALAGPATQIVPGHGAIATRADLVAYIEMLRKVRARCAEAIAKGESSEQFLARAPLSDLDAQWGGNLITGQAFAAMAYASASRISQTTP